MFGPVQLCSGGKAWVQVVEASVRMNDVALSKGDVLAVEKRRPQAERRPASAS